MHGNGKFIVIEGSDGAGKKTQADLLMKNLADRGVKYGYADFPQYEKSFFGKMVGRYLNGEFGDVGESNPYLISLLYAGDRFEASNTIRDQLNQGKIIISNRYTQSNMGFQTAKIEGDKEKEKFLSWLEELEYSIYRIPKPDLVIYLYLPYKTSQALVDLKDKRKYTDKKRDIHERNGDFLAKVEDQYLSLAKKYPEWKVIDCSDSTGNLQSIKAIGKKVFKVVEAFVDLPRECDISASGEVAGLRW